MCGPAFGGRHSGGLYCSPAEHSGGQSPGIHSFSHVDKCIPQVRGLHVLLFLSSSCHMGSHTLFSEELSLFLERGCLLMAEDS